MCNARVASNLKSLTTAKQRHGLAWTPGNIELLPTRLQARSQQRGPI